MKDFPVDIVYTWVDGNDPEWIEKKQKTLSNYSEFHQTKEVSGEARFTAREELKYSLRSIEKYAPWVRKIFIVTDNQTPSWLDTDNNKIEIVDHKDIFDKQYLPSYNSNAIESCIHKVPDLSNNFLSMNDDFFIGRPSKISDFFHAENKPKLFMGKKFNQFSKNKLLTIESIKKLNPHQYAIFNARQLIFEKYNVIVNYNLRHGIKAMNKDNMFTLEKLFFPSFVQTQKNQFRDKSDVWTIALDAFNSISSGENRPYYLKPYRRDHFKYRLSFMRKMRDYVFIPLDMDIDKIISKINAIKNYEPLMFCVNDMPKTSSESYKIINDFFKEFYPVKSEFEE